MTGVSGSELDGDALVALLAAISHPQRVRILGALGQGRTHVSELARQLGMSRPLLYLHLRKLELVGLIVGRLELSPDGRAMKFYDVVPFDVRLAPAVFVKAANTLTAGIEAEPDGANEGK
ncbi:MAG: winged helix-turn-helix transcriptional regulator [Bauldia sp.]|nr:winged helix-turn-helix transcriptional regulator [Bauldia sp.]MCW5717218.1 winged helix-turn-helix transcriptional regulator [Bauldia sp.]